MMRNEFWNDIASKGAILGAAMLVSHIFEQLFVMSGSMTRIAIVGFEMIAAAAIYVWMLWRFSKRAAAKFGNGLLGYGYGQAWIYVVYVSLFAGVLVGLGSYLCTHYVIGYDNYIERITAMYRSVIESSPMPASIGAAYDYQLAQMHEQPEPSVFATVISSVISYAFSGMFAGLFIAAGVKRNPDIFGNDTNDSDDDE